MSIFSLFPDLLAPRFWSWLLSGWAVTIASAAVVITLSTLLGLLFALARSAQTTAVRWLAGIYLSIFRNTPLLVQLFFWYFAVPGWLPSSWIQALNQPTSSTALWWQWPLPSFEVLACITGLVLYSTAYVGEEIRAGLRGIAAGQTQAAQALGMTHGQTLRYITLPQALRHVISPLFGQYMNIVKNTSLGMTIGLAELSYRARQVEAETFQSFQVYAITTAMYILIVIALQMLSQRWEHTHSHQHLIVRHA